MARNIIERAVKRFLMQAAKMSKGITTTGSSVPLTMVSQAGFDAARTTYKSSEDGFGLARQALKSARDIYAPAGAAVYDFLNAARPIFAGSFGYQWSADWVALGWTSPNTAIPRSQDDRIQLVDSIATFLTANPSYEVAKAGVTAANAAAIHENAFELQGDVTDAERDLRTADTARTAAHGALVGQMQSLIKNLGGKLSKADPRWMAFGLNMPASKTTPDQPTGLAAQMDLMTGGVILTCDAQALGERFRFRGREANSGMPFQLLASAAAATGRTKPLAPGAQMEFLVQAVNGGAQSVPSESIFFTIPSMPTGDGMSETATPAKLLSVTAPSAKRNGKSNGRSNGHGAPAHHRLG